MGGAGLHQLLRKPAVRDDDGAHLAGGKGAAGGGNYQKAVDLIMEPRGGGRSGAPRLPPRVGEDEAAGPCLGEAGRQISPRLRGGPSSSKPFQSTAPQTSSPPCRPCPATRAPSTFTPTRAFFGIASSQDAWLEHGQAVLLGDLRRTSRSEPTPVGLDALGVMPVSF